MTYEQLMADVALMADAEGTIRTLSRESAQTIADGIDGAPADHPQRGDLDTLRDLIRTHHHI